MSTELIGWSKRLSAIAKINKDMIITGVIIFLATSFLFYKYILQLFPSVITHQLMVTYHLNGAGLGNCAAWFFYTYLIVQLFAGPLLDRFSVQLIASLALLTSAIGACLFAWTNCIEITWLARGLMGVGAAFATVCYMKITSIYFNPKYFAFVGGLLTLGVMLGALFGEAPFAVLTQKMGWRATVWLTGIMGLCLAFGYWCFPRNAAVAKKNLTHSESKISLALFLQILKSKTNWILLLYSGFAFVPLAVFGGLWGTPFLQAVYHMTTAKTAAYVSLIYIGFGIGGPFFGYFSDRMNNRFSFMQFGLIFSLICLTTIIYVPHLNLISLSILLLGFGFGTGAYMLVFTVGKEMNSILLTATVIGFINTGDSLLGAVTEPLIGKILDYFGQNKIVTIHSEFSIQGYHYSLSILMIYFIIGFFCLRKVISLSKN